MQQTLTLSVDVIKATELKNNMIKTNLAGFKETEYCHTKRAALYRKACKNLYAVDCLNFIF